jgi:hypothetical protein
MREIIKTFKVYKYDELKGKARDRAFLFLKEGYEDCMADEFVDNMEKAVEKLRLGVEGYDLNEYDGRVTIFYGKYDNDLNDICGARAVAFVQNNFFSHIDKRRYMNKLKVYSPKDYTHLPDKGWMDESKLTGYYTDYALKMAWEKFVKKLRSGYEPSVSDFIGYLEKSFVKIFEDEMQGYNDDMAKEDAESNEFEFNENGEVYLG